MYYYRNWHWNSLRHKGKSRIAGAAHASAGPGSADDDGDEFEAESESGVSISSLSSPGETSVNSTPMVNTPEVLFMDDDGIELTNGSEVEQDNSHDETFGGVAFENESTMQKGKQKEVITLSLSVRLIALVTGEDGDEYVAC